MTEWLHFHFSLSRTGEGNGNPLQCSCLENPRDGGAWWAAVYGVAQNRTRLKWLSSSSKATKAITSEQVDINDNRFTERSAWSGYCSKEWSRNNMNESIKTREHKVCIGKSEYKWMASLKLFWILQLFRECKVTSEIHRQALFYCALLYYPSQILDFFFFLRQMEAWWHPCVIQDDWCHFLKSIC